MQDSVKVKKQEKDGKDAKEIKGKRHSPAPEPQGDGYSPTSPASPDLAVVINVDDEMCDDKRETGSPMKAPHEQFVIHSQATSPLPVMPALPLQQPPQMHFLPRMILHSR